MIIRNHLNRKLSYCLIFENSTATELSSVSVLFILVKSMNHITAFEEKISDSFTAYITIFIYNNSISIGNPNSWLFSKACLNNVKKSSPSLVTK